jgi:methionyl-tRNA formyltransferase
MRLVFAGTPEFAALALRQILAAGHQVVLVLTQPDRPSGRGMALRASPVKELANAAGIEVFQPPTLRDALVQQRIRAAGAEAMIVAAYGLILPPAVLDMPPHGCLNIHASLLPRWRGAAPIQRAILAGDQETGVSHHADGGRARYWSRSPVGTRCRSATTDTAASLHETLALLGGRLIVDVLARLPLRAVPSPRQGHHLRGARSTRRRPVSTGTCPAWQLARQVRAFNPFPGSHLLPRRRPAQGLAGSRRWLATGGRAMVLRPLQTRRCRRRLRRAGVAPRRVAEGRRADACRPPSIWPARRSRRVLAAPCRVLEIARHDPI